MPKKTRRDFAIEILIEEIRIRRQIININFSQVTSLEDSIKIIQQNKKP